MTKLYILNRFFLQWFFIRLTRNEKKVIKNFRLTECSLMPDGSYSMGWEHKPEDVQIIKSFSIQFWVIPETGWSNNFRYLGSGPKFLNIQNPKKCQ